MLKKNQFCVIYCVLAMIVLLFTGCVQGGAKRNVTDSVWLREAMEAKGEAIMELQAKIDAQKIKLREQTGEDSLYPTFFAGVAMERVRKTAKPEAVKVAKAWMVRRAALEWYAKKRGIVLTKEDAEKRLETYLADIKGADNIAQVEAYYEKEGISLEASMWADLNLCRQNFIIEDLAGEIQDFYMRGALTDEEILNWDRYWQRFQKKVIKSYRDTEEYDRLMNALRACEQLYPARSAGLEGQEEKIAATVF